MTAADATKTDPGSSEGAAATTVAPRRATALPLAAALIVLGLGYLCVDIVSPAVPVISESLGVSATGAGLIISAFFGGRLVSNLPAAWMVDRVGPRLTAVAGALALGSGSAAAALAGSEGPFLAARALQGCGMALLATAGLLSLLRALPRGGAAMTAFNLCVGIGGTAGLYSGGWLTATFGWRGIFWFSALLAAIAFAAALASHSIAARRKRRPELAAPSAAEPEVEPAPLFGAASVSAMLANLLVFANYSIWVVGLPLYAATRFGAGTEAIALLLVFINVVHLLGALPTGRIIRLFGPRTAMTFGFASVALGMATMILAPNERWLLLPMALYAFGLVAGNSGSGDLLLRLGGGGRGVAMVRFTSDLGLVIGPAAAGALADAAGVSAPFAALAAFSAGAAILSAVTMRRGARAG